MTSRADLGDLAEGAAATPFSLKFCIILIEFSENKKYLYSWQVGKCPSHPFLNFLDPSLDLQLSRGPLREGRMWIS